MKRNLRAEAFLNALRITHNISTAELSQLCADMGLMIPKESFLDKLLYYYDNEREEYYRNVFNL